jgi:hypothetical protein
LQAVELVKTMTVLPDQVLDPWEERWSAFDNRNGLVKDPEHEVGGLET